MLRVLLVLLTALALTAGPSVEKQAAERLQGIQDAETECCGPPPKVCPPFCDETA